MLIFLFLCFFFFQAEDGIRDGHVTGVQTCALPISLNQYHVVMEVAPQYWQSPESLANVYVLSPTRGQVPLSAIARYEPTTAPLAVNHQGQFVATTISFNLALGVSLGEAADAINRTMAEIGRAHV